MVKFDPETRRRRSIRLAGYDYSQAGVYFVTICAADRMSLFGRVADGRTNLSALGESVSKEWLRSEKIRRELELDHWVLMPNHLHGVCVLVPSDGNRDVAPVHPGLSRPPRSLGSFVAGFKAATTRLARERFGFSAPSLWQSNYWEHIVRNEDELARIREYIALNPARWNADPDNPDADPGAMMRESWELEGVWVQGARRAPLQVARSLQE
jgi:REP element-mobilizing transposase RayT